MENRLQPNPTEDSGQAACDFEIGERDDAAGLGDRQLNGEA